jgi:secreted Zn-dependent insulinase-like peptidase
MILPSPCSFSFSVESPSEFATTVTFVYFQIGSYNYIERLLANLLDSIMGPQLFKELRTVQQLGYTVESHAYLENSVISFLIYIESSSKDPNYIDNAIEDFLHGPWNKFINNLSENDFNDYKNALQSVIESQSEINNEGFHLFKLIFTNEDDWDYKNHLIAKLNQITLENFREFSCRYITNTATRKRFSIHQYGAIKPNTKVSFFQEEISDIYAFKAAQTSYYPNPYQSDPNQDPYMYYREGSLGVLIVQNLWWVGLIVAVILVIIIVFGCLYWRRGGNDDYRLL